MDDQRGSEFWQHFGLLNLYHVEHFPYALQLQDTTGLHRGDFCTGDQALTHLEPGREVIHNYNGALICDRSVFC